MLSDEQFVEIRNLYKLAEESLMEIEREIARNGILDNGLSDSSESFEQGYLNAIECICNILEINI